MTESHATRQNADGHPCPPWCVTDHDARPDGPAWRFHDSKTSIIETPSGYVQASAYQYGFGDDAPQVCLTSLNGPPGCLLLGVQDAEKLAAVVEQLADATPEQHRELAAAIRQAAAVITEADQ